MKKEYYELLTDKYFNMIYPNFGKLGRKPKLKILVKDKAFIEDHIMEIDKAYEAFIRTAKYVEDYCDLVGEVSREEIIKIINNIKINEYFSMIYPEFESLTQEEKSKATLDKKFIADHIEKIDEDYYEATHIKGRIKNGIDRQKMMMDVLNKIKRQIVGESNSRLGPENLKPENRSI